MEKQDFMKLGIKEEVAIKCTRMWYQQLKNFIPKERFNDVNDAKKKAILEVHSKDEMLKQLKLDSEILLEISNAGGKNSKAIKSLLNLEIIKLENSGKLIGLSEQLDMLKKAEDSKFLFIKRVKLNYIMDLKEDVYFILE